MRVIAKVTRSARARGSEEDDEDESSYEEDEDEEEKRIEPDYSGGDDTWPGRRHHSSNFSLGDELSQISASEAARANLDGKNPLLEFAMRFFRGGRETSPDGTLR